jgi:hypothetical protein
MTSTFIRMILRGINKVATARHLLARGGSADRGEVRSK